MSTVEVAATPKTNETENRLVQEISLDKIKPFVSWAKFEFRLLGRILTESEAPLSFEVYYRF